MVDVVIIEDDRDQARSISGVLERAGLKVAPTDNTADGLELIRRLRPRIVLCDYDLPDGNALDLCHAVRQDVAINTVYLIVMSAAGTGEIPEAVLEAGADDALNKLIGQRELVARVRVGLRMHAMHEQLRRAAVTDGLTGLYNHDHFNRLLDTEMGRARRYGHPLALIMIDIDHFKAINDTFGHLAGNETLREMAHIMRRSVRDIDVVARFGGEEFAVILPQAATSAALQVAGRMKTAIDDELRLAVLHNHTVTASFGVADSDDARVANAADLVDLADRALIAAKQQGRDRIVCARQMGDAGEASPSLELGEVERLRGRVAALGVRVKDICLQSMSALLQTLNEKDRHSARHACNVALYAREIAEQLGCSPAIVKSVYHAALLHDIGKVGIPDRILKKLSPLTPLEKLVVQQVPMISSRIVDHLRILEAEIQIIRHQREQYDGSGRPSGLRGDQIPIGARILLVADAFDAMTTDRVYRRSRPVDDAVTELQSCAGRQFDPRVVTALRQALAANRTTWDQRIQDTIQTMQRPEGESAELFNELDQNLATAAPSHWLS